MPALTTPPALTLLEHLPAIVSHGRFPLSWLESRRPACQTRISQHSPQCERCVISLENGLIRTRTIALGRHLMRLFAISSLEPFPKHSTSPSIRSVTLQGGVSSCRPIPSGASVPNEAKVFGR